MKKKKSITKKAKATEAKRNKRNKVSKRKALIKPLKNAAQEVNNYLMFPLFEDIYGLL